jgi:hypothetical protein
VSVLRNRYTSVELREWIFNLDLSVSDFYLKAAIICLDNQKHYSETVLEVYGDFSKNEYILCWQGPSNSDKSSWGDLKKATEYGAYGVAFMIISRITNFNHIERMPIGNGFDFFLRKTLIIPRIERPYFQNRE